MFNAYDNATPGSFTSPVDRFAGVLNAAQSSTDDFASKPWGIAEWGSTLTPAQDQAFYDSAKAAVDANTYPRIKAYVVWDSDSGSVPATQDLRVAYDANHTADATKADHYYAFAADPALSGSYDPPPLPPDVTAPTVSLTSPADGDQVSGAVTVDGAASDDRGVSQVELLVDGQDSTVGVSAPSTSFALTWDSTGVGNGTHTLQLTASDGAGNAAQLGRRHGYRRQFRHQRPERTDPAHRDHGQPGRGRPELGRRHRQRRRRPLRRLPRRDVVGRTAGATTTFADAGVAAVTQYSYQVSAVDAAQNEGDLSSPRVVTTPALADVTPPSTPTGLTAVAVSSSEIDLRWNASTDNVGVADYRVYRDGTVVTTVGSATSWADTAVTEASTHSYAITAMDAAGNESPPSPTVTTGTPDVTAPSAPGGLVATTVGAGEIDLGWTAATDNVAVTGYHVYRDGNLLATLGPVTGYADRSVSDAHTYSYRVDAFDGAGNVGTPTAAVTASTSRHNRAEQADRCYCRVDGLEPGTGDVVGRLGQRGRRRIPGLPRRRPTGPVGAASTTYTDVTVSRRADLRLFGQCLRRGRQHQRGRARRRP